MALKLFNRKTVHIALVSLLLIGAAETALAISSTGIVTHVQSPTNAGVNAIYFKMNPMPQIATTGFYLRNGSGNSADCVESDSEKSTDRAYSALLTAKASSRSITVDYCLDSNGYGLVNGFVRIN